jgi:hypothetical protein
LSHSSIGTSGRDENVNEQPVINLPDMRDEVAPSWVTDVADYLDGGAA